MGIEHISGTAEPFVSGEEIDSGEKEGLVVIVKGEYALLPTFNPKTVVPQGYTILRKLTTSDGDGMGTMRIQCIDYGDDSTSAPATPYRITYQIEMAEVVTPLECHHKITGNAAKEVRKWLATDEAHRFDSSGDPQYLQADGSYKQMDEQTAKDFVAAYMAGITTYNRYFPVINQISWYRRVPGLTLDADKQCVTGGSPAFSVAGTFNTPPIALSGYASTGWFASKDSWQQHESKVWQRVRQWTWTPDGSTGTHKWIYN